MGFGALLRAARVRAGITQADLAARVGVRQQAVNRWEMGKDVPQPATVRELARLFGWSASDVAVALGYVDPEGDDDRRWIEMPRDITEEQLEALETALQLVIRAFGEAS